MSYELDNIAPFTRADEQERVAEVSLDAMKSRFESGTERLVSALAKHYNVDTTDFSFITLEGEDGEENNWAVYTATHGLPPSDPKGESFDGLMVDDRHIIEVDGEIVDTRALTYAVYKKWVQGLIDNGVAELPDSTSVNRKTYTWLFGVESKGGAMMCSIDRGRPGMNWADRVDIFDDVLVRPAVRLK